MLSPIALLKRTTKRFLRSFLLYVTNHIIAGTLFSSIRLCWYRIVMRYKIGRNTSVLVGFKVAGSKNLEIGEHTIINNECRFDNRLPIKIGSNVSISYETMILTNGHDIDDPDFTPKGSGVNIEDYVWICARATILPGVTLGEGAVVLPGSVVCKDVPPYTVVGGNPAKKIRERKMGLKYNLNWNPRVPLFG